MHGDIDESQTKFGACMISVSLPGMYNYIVACFELEHLVRSQRASLGPLVSSTSLS